MRISDVLFFSTLIICLILICLSTITGLELSDYFVFWWVILVPFAFIKVLFPKSKINKWLEKEIK